MEDRWELSAEQSPGFGPIAERFRRAGELDRAVALCREGLAKFPNHLSGRVTLGWALLDLGRYDEARVELERVLKRAPDNLAAIRGLAELHDRADHVEFAPTETPIASWPPKPDPAEAVVVGEAPAPTVSSTWRDPEAFATAPASAVSTTEKPESAVEIAPDELPALLAELDPLLTTSETAAESIEAAPSVALQSSVSEVVADAPALESLEAAMAELAASGAHAEAETGALVAELAVSDTAELDKALSDLTRVDQPATPVEAVITAAAVSDVAPAASTEALVEQLQSSNDAVEVMPDVFPVLDENPLPEPAMDVLAELAEIEDEPGLDTAIEPAAIVAAQAVELSLSDSVDPLIEAAEAVEVMAAPAMESEMLAAEATHLAAAAVDLGAGVGDLPHMESASVELDVDVPLDTAIFELAHASIDHAVPNVEAVRDDAFELDPELHVEMTSLLATDAPREFHAPESASVAGAADSARDVEHPSRDAAALGRHAREPQLEQAYEVSQAFASAINQSAEFASPQLPPQESSEAEVLAPIASSAPLVADSQWPEPEQPSAEPAAPEAVAVPQEAVAVAQAEIAPAQPEPVKPRKRPVAGLQKFLRRAEGRKAKLASHSAA